MRYGEFLRLPAEVSRCHMLRLQGRSIAVDGHSTNYEGAGAQLDYDLISLAYNSTTRDRLVFRVDLSPVREAIGHTPVLVLAQLLFCSHPSGSPDVSGKYARIFPFQPSLVPDISGTGSATNRYRDKSELITWEGDAYAPVPGKSVPAWDDYTDRIEMVETDPDGDQDIVWNVTADVRRALLAGTEWYGMIVGETYNSAWEFWGIGASPRWPWMRYWYLYQVEFFHAAADDQIDLTSMVDTGLEENLFYLGALERGETGTPIKGFLKNFGDRDLDLVEIFDDHPEWSDPIQTDGTGTGSLDYVELASNAVSQKYEIRFTSGSAYEIRATAYRDNPDNLNPTYGGAGWTGDTGSDFVAPDGGLELPSAAWGAGTLVNDVFEVYVKGNSSEASWPSDSGAMLQLARDDGGTPDDATWRPATGRRTKLTAGVTIDAATKTISVRHITAANWPAGTKIFIGDGTNLDEGVVQSATATTITIESLAVTSNSYAAGAKVGTTLPVEGLTAAIWGTTTADAGASETPANRIYLHGPWPEYADPSTLGFLVGQEILIAAAGAGDVKEYATISFVGGTYIDLDAVLTEDYPSGAIVMVRGSGEKPFWMRVVAPAGTTEELKQARLNIRA